MVHVTFLEHIQYSDRAYSQTVLKGWMHIFNSNSPITVDFHPAAPSLSLHFSLSSPRWGENQQTGLTLGTAQRAFSSSVKYLSHDAVLTSSAKWSHYFIEMKVLWNPPSHHHFIEHQHSYKHSFEDIGTSFNKSLEKKITLETRQILRFQSSYPSLFQPSPKET